MFVSVFRACFGRLLFGFWLFIFVVVFGVYFWFFGLFFSAFLLFFFVFLLFFGGFFGLFFAPPTPPKRLSERG
ncbi:MAG: hypothetical protein BGP01_00490 [Paludibacter sp. 47-17]|nr:MAG: hypothetical protein BGP01_00490 [Paludibacter sp. 47-17]